MRASAGIRRGCWPARDSSAPAKRPNGGRQNRCVAASGRLLSGWRRQRRIVHRQNDRVFDAHRPQRLPGGKSLGRWRAGAARRSCTFRDSRSVPAVPQMSAALVAFIRIWALHADLDAKGSAARRAAKRADSGYTWPLRLVLSFRPLNRKTLALKRRRGPKDLQWACHIAGEPTAVLVQSQR